MSENQSGNPSINSSNFDIFTFLRILAHLGYMPEVLPQNVTFWISFKYSVGQLKQMLMGIKELSF